MSVREGEAARDRGIALVEGTHEDDDWANAAERWVTDLAPGTVFTAAHLTAAVGMPSHRNRVGATVRGIASRTEMIVKVGTTKSATTSRHAAVVAEWLRVGPGDRVTPEGYERAPLPPPVPAPALVPPEAIAAARRVSRWADGQRRTGLIVVAPEFEDIDTLCRFALGEL